MSATQCAQILAALQAGRSLTPLDAFDEMNCMRLGARVYELKQQGHAIDSEMVEDPRTGKHYASYTLRPAPVQLPFELAS